MAQVAHNFLTDAEKQSLQDIDYLIDGLEEEVAHLKENIHNTQTTWAIKVAMFKRERLRAFAALLKSKIIFADMQIFLAENNLNQVNNTNNEKLTTREEKSQRQQHQVPSRRSSSLSSTSLRSGSVTPNQSRRSRTPHDSIKNNISDKRPKESSPKLVTPPSDTTYDVNKTTSTMSQSPVSVTSDSVTVSRNNSVGASRSDSVSVSRRDSVIPATVSSNSNRALTNSIIAEFNKPYQKTEMTGNSSLSSVRHHSTSTEDNMSLPKSIKRTRNVKINPISNIDAYKNAYSKDRLSFKSHVLYSPDASCVRSTLHPKDPRAYYSKLTLEPKDSQIPMKLPVPSLLLENDAPSQPKIVEQIQEAEKCMQTPAKRLKKDQDSSTVVKPAAVRQVFTPVPVNHKYHTNITTSTPVKQPRNHPVSVPSTFDMLDCHDFYKVDSVTPKKKFENVAHGNFTEQRPMPVSTPQKWFENKHICVPVTPLFKHSARVDHVTPKKKLENVAPHNFTEQRPMPVSTPQKWFENKHICVPVMPMYRHGAEPYVQSNTKGSVKVPRLESNAKENYKHTSPKRVCFYHSS